MEARASNNDNSDKLRMEGQIMIMMTTGSSYQIPFSNTSYGDKDK